MFDQDYIWTETDQVCADMLKGFIPKKVFDAHMHMYILAADVAPGGIYRKEYCTPSMYREDMMRLLPGALSLDCNMMPMPDKRMNEPDRKMLDLANGHICRQLKENADLIGAAFIMPGDSMQQILQLLDHPGVKCIKCYWTAVGKEDGETCRIEEFLPPHIYEAAAKRNVPIILHMMKPAALADPENYHYITGMAEKYPDVNVVLAHCARGFASWTVVDTVYQLAEYENIWFDLSAICESGPIMAVIKATDAKRVMWGSDYPICMMRGKAISLADSFYWLTDDALKPLKPQRGEACLVGLENLMAMRQACTLLNLTTAQIEDLFYGNAKRLFGLAEKR